MSDQQRVPEDCTDEELRARLQALEAEVVELRLALRRRAHGKPKSFGDLRGIFAGRMKVTEDDLAEAEYHFEWDGETQR